MTAKCNVLHLFNKPCSDDCATMLQKYKNTTPVDLPKDLTESSCLSDLENSKIVGSGINCEWEKLPQHKT